MSKMPERILAYDEDENGRDVDRGWFDASMHSGLAYVVEYIRLDLHEDREEELLAVVKDLSHMLKGIFDEGVNLAWAKVALDRHHQIIEESRSVK